MPSTFINQHIKFIISILKKHGIKIYFFLLFFFLLLRSSFLIYQNINLTYPFLAADSYDWIANGLFLEGYNVSYSYRPPALPLIIAALDHFNFLNFLPALNQLILFLIIWIFYKIQIKFFSQKASLLTSIIISFNFFINSFSLYILADLYALICILTGIYFFINIKNNNDPNIFYSSFFFSISILFQYAILPILPALLLYYFYYKKLPVSKRTLIYALTPFFFTTGLWFVYKKITFGSFFYSGVKQVELLHLHFNSIYFYFFNFFSVLGITLALLILSGIFYFLHKKLFLKTKSSDILSHYLLLNLFCILFWIIFWVLLYTWNDRRFMLYLIFFILPFATLLINKIISKKYLRHLLLPALALLSIYQTSIPYSGPLSLDELFLTSKISVKHTTNIDKATYNTNINFYNPRFNIQENYYLNPLNLNQLIAYKNNQSLALYEHLTKIKSDLRNPKEICIIYKQSKDQWYMDKNKLGNFLKAKILKKDTCEKPYLLIEDHINNIALITQ